MPATTVNGSTEVTQQNRVIDALLSFVEKGTPDLSYGSRDFPRTAEVLRKMLPDAYCVRARIVDKAPCRFWVELGLSDKSTYVEITGELADVFEAELRQVVHKKMMTDILTEEELERQQRIARQASARLEAHLAAETTLSAQTLGLYDEIAPSYAKQTAFLDMSGILDPFLERMPIGGTILDAGCGSGRDAHAMTRVGYKVVAIDGSQRMCKMAENLLGFPARHLRFQDMDFKEQFDGIWACASLVHLEDEDLRDVLRRMVAALKPTGMLYASFVEGAGMHVEGGRLFNDMNLERILDFLENSGGKLQRSWSTPDQLGRDHTWFNCNIVRA